MLQCCVYKIVHEEARDVLECDRKRRKKAEQPSHQSIKRRGNKFSILCRFSDLAWDINSLSHSGQVVSSNIEESCYVKLEYEVFKQCSSLARQICNLQTCRMYTRKRARRIKAFICDRWHMFNVRRFELSSSEVKITQIIWKFAVYFITTSTYNYLRRLSLCDFKLSPADNRVIFHIRVAFE